MTENDCNKLKDFLVQETEKARKGIGMAYFCGILAAFIIGGYMAFILHMEKTFLQPDNLAYLIRIQAEEAIPNMIQQTEQAIVKRAEDSAQQISDRFITLVPQMTEAGMKQIDLAYTEQIPFITEEFSLIVSEYIHLHGPELANFAAAHTSEEFAEHFTELMMAEFHKQLDTRLADVYGGRDLGYIKENMASAIVAMNLTVEELLATDPDDMDRTMALKRRLLSRLVASALESETE